MYMYMYIVHVHVCAGGESGSADTVRDPRGFAVKFYTEDGNWDLVGNNTPIFFIRDPILVDWIHVQYIHVHSIIIVSRVIILL